MVGSRVADAYLCCLGWLVLELLAAALLPAGAAPGSDAWLVQASLVPIGALVLLPIAVVAALAVRPLAEGIARISRLSRSVRVALLVSVAAFCELVGASGAGRADGASGVALLGVGLLCVAGLPIALRNADAPADKRALRFAFGRGVLGLLLFALAAASLPRASATLHASGPEPGASPRGLLLAAVAAIARELDPSPAAPPPSEAPIRVPDALDLDGYDVLLISVAALRADHVGAYGYDRATTPAIDGMAREGVLFEAAYSQSSQTEYAVPSMMTGKVMRPLLAMGLAADSGTLADLLTERGYQSAAFYPATVFGSDDGRLAGLRDRKLGFQSAVIGSRTASARADEVAAHLERVANDKRVFLWVHLEDPHEPYVQRSRMFGSRDIDRYDSEIAEADAAIARIVDDMRRRRPKTLVIITADHGEEFGEHGGRYHGTSVYEEQVRVPLVLFAPGLLSPRRVASPVELVALMPTVLAGLGMPPRPELGGRDLGPLMFGAADAPNASASAETEQMSLLAEGQLRLVCQRRIGVCSLFDLARDPRQRRDVAASQPRDLTRLRAALDALTASYAKLEQKSSSAEQPGLPEPLQRALAGDGSAALAVAALLDGREVELRRKAARALFELRRSEVALPLRRALAKETDPETKAYVALSLVRLGEGAPYVFELLDGPEPQLRRLAALVLAESGDRRGEDILLAWWRAAFPDKRAVAADDALSFERARQVLDAIAAFKSKDSIGSLLVGLRDDRLRPFVAKALAHIGEDAARPALAERLYEERNVMTRLSLIQALLSLGAGPELRESLVSLLGMPEPVPDGVRAVLAAKLLAHVGGPVRDSERNRLRRFAASGVIVDFVVPELTKGAVAPKEGARVRVLCRATASSAGEIRIGARADVPRSSEKKAPIPANRPVLDGKRAATLTVPAGEGAIEVFADLPDQAGARLGKQVSLVLYATQGIELEACVLVPRREELVVP